MTAHHTIDLLERILDPISRCLTPDAARKLVELRADVTAQQRMDELAEKCSEGLLTPEERDEYESYVAVGSVIAVLQAKARKVTACNSFK